MFGFFNKFFNKNNNTNNAEITELQRQVDILQKQNFAILSTLKLYEISGMAPQSVFVAQVKIEEILKKNLPYQQTTQLMMEVVKGLSKDFSQNETFAKQKEELRKDAQRELDLGYFSFEEMREKDELTKQRIKEAEAKEEEINNMTKDIVASMFGIPPEEVQQILNEELGFSQVKMPKEENKKQCDVTCENCDCQDKNKDANEWLDELS